MSDKELLELAAKAAGINQNVRTFNYWNPLADDGDALRLAVKLGFMVNVVYVNLEKSIGTVHAIGDGFETAVQDFGEDSYAATRRAIVRAAAEIGKANP